MNGEQPIPGDYGRFAQPALQEQDDDSRLASGTPKTLGAGDLDFIRLTGMIRPEALAPIPPPAQDGTPAAAHVKEPAPAVSYESLAARGFRDLIDALRAGDDTGAEPEESAEKD